METVSKILPVPCGLSCSPFGGIPRNWKHSKSRRIPPEFRYCSPFGGIPRNWKPLSIPSGGSQSSLHVPPSGGSLEIGNLPFQGINNTQDYVPPSGGSLEIGNFYDEVSLVRHYPGSPFGGIPRNWKPQGGQGSPSKISCCSPFGGIPRNWKPRTPGFARS